MSSNDALQKARRLYNAAKAGHTGTLDPLATGLLPLCFGEATKFAGELLDADKSYLATVRLGIVTDTADAEGRVLETRPVAVSPAQLETVLARFVGVIEQVPPMYSALKREGKPLYAYARAGIEVERAARRVTIAALTLLAHDVDSLVLDVSCSKGTYVRTLAADIGAMLGCGAHLAALRRTRIGRLTLDDATTLDALGELDTGARDRSLLPVDALVAGFPRVDLGAPESARIAHGQAVRAGFDGVGNCRLYDPEGRFLGLGVGDSDGWVKPKRLVAE